MPPCVAHRSLCPLSLRAALLVGRQDALAAPTSSRAQPAGGSPHGPSAHLRPHLRAEEVVRLWLPGAWIGAMLALQLHTWPLGWLLEVACPARAHPFLLTFLALQALSPCS